MLTDDEILGASASDKEHPPSELKELESREVSTETKKTEKEKSSFASTDDSSCSEDSEADYESKSRGFVTEMKEEELRKFCEKKKKARPGLASVRAAINGKLVKSNSIFEEPSKSVPLPREAGVINIKFSERKFPTPARESSHLEEQEVTFSFVIQTDVTETRACNIDIRLSSGFRSKRRRGAKSASTRMTCGQKSAIRSG